MARFYHRVRKSREILFSRRWSVESAWHERPDGDLVQRAVARRSHGGIVRRDAATSTHHCHPVDRQSVGRTARSAIGPRVHRARPARCEADHRIGKPRLGASDQRGLRSLRSAGRSPGTASARREDDQQLLCVRRSLCAACSGFNACRRSSDSSVRHGPGASHWQTIPIRQASRLLTGARFSSSAWERLPAD